MIDAGMMSQEADAESTPQKKKAVIKAADAESKVPEKTKGPAKRKTASDHRKAMYGSV